MKEYKYQCERVYDYANSSEVSKDELNQLFMDVAKDFQVNRCYPEMTELVKLDSPDSKHEMIAVHFIYEKWITLFVYSSETNKIEFLQSAEEKNFAQDKLGDVIALIPEVELNTLNDNAFSSVNWKAVRSAANPFALNPGVFGVAFDAAYTFAQWMTNNWDFEAFKVQIDKPEWAEETLDYVAGYGRQPFEKVTFLNFVEKQSIMDCLFSWNDIGELVELFNHILTSENADSLTDDVETFNEYLLSRFEVIFSEEYADEEAEDEFDLAV